MSPALGDPAPPPTRGGGREAFFVAALELPNDSQ